MHILLSDCIPKDDLELADHMLTAFHNEAGRLYSLSIYTANMHSAIHTVPLAKLWGPIWSYSMFGFENLNGYIGITFHGTRDITKQISFNIQLKQSLPFKLKELYDSEENEETRKYLEGLIQGKQRGMQQIGVDCYIVGKTHSNILTQTEKQALSRVGISCHLPNVHSFSVVLLRGVLYYSEVHGRQMKRCNTICTYHSISGSTDYGRINSFCNSSNTGPVCFIENLRATGTSPITRLRPPRSAEIRKQNVDMHLRNKIVGVVSTGLIVAVPICNIVKKCTKVKDYIIPAPNFYEVH